MTGQGWRGGVGVGWVYEVGGGRGVSYLAVGREDDG